MRRSPALDETQIREVSEWALRAESALGQPQDVEWAIASGRVHVVQSRPAARYVASTQPPESGKWVLFKPLYENFTEPMTPLTGELFNPIRSNVRVFFGRVYYNLLAVRVFLPF